MFGVPFGSSSRDERVPSKQGASELSQQRRRISPPEACRLCGEVRPLRKSHVLPEFVYRPLYDDHHRFYVMDARTGWSSRRAQKGLTDRLLCDACEQFLSPYEKYAAEVMTGRSSAKVRQFGTRVHVSGLDYPRFKLFLLSVLWRSSATQQEFFKFVSLGPHEERIRQMILERRPGRSEEYGCAVVFASLSQESLADTIFNPEAFRWAGRRFYKLFFAGAAWCFYCDSRRPPDHCRRLFLREDGTLLGARMDIEQAKAAEHTAKRLAKRIS